MPNTKIKQRQLYLKLKGGASSRASASRSKSQRQSQSKPNLTKSTLKVKQIQKTPIFQLITAKSQVNVKINYKNIKLNCMLGNKKLIVGNNDDMCIEIIYFPEHNFCRLEGFFYKVNKGTCKSKSFLNNSIFMDNTKVNGRIPGDYNKKFNETMMELFDIINIDVGMKQCTLRDGSEIKGTKCGDIKMTVLKHFERGYGFYNEFGFMYKNNIDKANTFLQTIIEIKGKSIDITNITYEYIFSLLESMGLQYEPVSEETIAIFKDIITTNQGITYQQFINEIMNYCKTSADTLPSGIFAIYSNENIIELKNLITIIAHNLLGGNMYSLTQCKLYDTSKNLVSRLINKDNDETRKFEMISVKNYNVEIETLVKTDNNIFDYEINILYA